MAKQKIPQKTKAILTSLTKKFKNILNQKLIGIYVHGSLALGGYNSHSSDIDILVVVKSKLNTFTKIRLGNYLLSLSKTTLGGGIELSIIKLAILKKFRYPTPYELHYSKMHEEAFRKKINFANNKCDHDLAAHFVITKQHGICLYGKPASNIFPDVPARIYLKSIVKDFNWSYKNVMRGSNTGLCWVPPYAVLNTCRLLAYIKEGLVISKIAGGQWAIKNLPKKYNSLILAALAEHRQSNKSNTAEAAILKQFMRYAKRTINDAKTIQIRLAEPADVRGILKVRKAAWLKTYPNKRYGITLKEIKTQKFFSLQRSARWKHSIMNRKENQHWVAEKNKKIVGFCMAIKKMSQHRIGSIYILPSYQNQRIGQKLSAAAFKWLGVNKKILVTVAKYNRQAIKFYKKIGFRKNRNVPASQSYKLPSGKPLPEIEMVRQV